MPCLVGLCKAARRERGIVRVVGGDRIGPTARGALESWLTSRCVGIVRAKG